MFKGRERMASVVTRWSTTPCIHRQSIAEHSFYVALYTDAITHLLKWDDRLRYHALHWALVHDMPETVTSDIPGPVKRIVTSAKMLKQTEDSIFHDLGEMYFPEPTEIIKRVVKAANLIDEVFYLRTEILMGNKFLDQVSANSWERMAKALASIDLAGLASLIHQELAEMAKGVVGLKNDDDLNG